MELNCSLYFTARLYVLTGEIKSVLLAANTMGKIIKTRNKSQGLLGEHSVLWAPNTSQGTQCVMSTQHESGNTVCYEYPTNRNPAQSLQENAITLFGPTLHNSLVKYLGDIESVNLNSINKIWAQQISRAHSSWWAQMHNFGTVARSNSILDQLSFRRAVGIY